MWSLIFGVNLMISNKRGQIRIIEALIACIILVAGLSASIIFSSIYTIAKASELEEVGVNVLHVLDNSGVIRKIIQNQGNWASEFKELMGTLLPPETFYNLTLFSSITNQPLAWLTNVVGQDFSSGADVASFQQIATVSFPYIKQEKQKIDIMLLIDRSGSMNEKEPGDEFSKIYYAKEATKIFTDQLNMSLARVGVISFSSEATLDVQLPNNTGVIKSAIDSLVASGYTNIGDSINIANEHFQSYGRSDSVWAYILLSDGKTNRPLPESYAREYAISESENSAEIGIATYSIGLGANTENFDEELLKQIATEGYYYAPSAEDLVDIYTAIAKDLLFAVKYDVVTLQLTLIRGG